MYFDGESRALVEKYKLLVFTYQDPSYYAGALRGEKEERRKPSVKNFYETSRFSKFQLFVHMLFRKSSSFLVLTMKKLDLFRYEDGESSGFGQPYLTRVAIFDIVKLSMLVAQDDTSSAESSSGMRVSDRRANR